VFDVYISDKKRVFVLDVLPFGEPTDPLLFDWDELSLPDDQEEEEEDDGASSPL